MAKFKVYIKSEKIYRKDKPIYIDVVIKNITDKDYYLSTVGTPFEEVPNDCFTVTKGGNKLHYDGIRIKRHRHDLERLHLIRAGEKLTTRIYLSELYPMHESGLYHVKINTKVLEPIRMSIEGIAENLVSREKIPDIHFSFYLCSGKSHRKTGGERLRERNVIRKSEADMDFPAPTVRFHKVQAAEEESKFKERVMKAHFEMIHYLMHCVNELTIVSEQDNIHYRLAFGSYDAGFYAEVKKLFMDILNKMKTEIVIYERNQIPKDEDCYAYTSYGSDTVYLAEYFYEMHPTGEDSHMGCLLHEWTHAVADTDDIRYGRIECMDLAELNPEKAKKNADNYELFLETKFLNWNYIETWNGTEDAKKAAAGGPTTVSDGKKMYIFYCGEDDVLKMAVSDGSEFGAPQPLTDRKGKNFSSEFHPEAIIYDNKIFLFYIPLGQKALSCTNLDLRSEELVWKEETPLLSERDEKYIPVYPPQPVLYYNNIVLIYKKENEEGFYSTYWNKEEWRWHLEQEIPDSGGLVEMEKYNPAAAVVNNKLYIVYRSEDDIRIKFAYYDLEAAVWKMDRYLEQYFDRYSSTDYEIRGVKLGDAVYLLTRMSEKTMGQIQVNYMKHYKQIIWTDGERLSNNTFPGSYPETASVCALSTLGDYNYLIGMEREKKGIFYGKQMII